jgi:hypothetical protein
MNDGSDPALGSRVADLTLLSNEPSPYDEV